MISLTKEQAEFVAMVLRGAENYEVKSDNPKFDYVLTSVFRKRFVDVAADIERQLKEHDDDQRSA